MATEESPIFAADQARTPLTVSVEILDAATEDDIKLVGGADWIWGDLFRSDAGLECALSDFEALWEQRLLQNGQNPGERLPERIQRRVLHIPLDSVLVLAEKTSDGLPRLIVFAGVSEDITSSKSEGRTRISVLKSDILKVLLQKQAFSFQNRMNSDLIFRDIRNKSADSVRKAARDLVKLGLLDSHKVAGGGYWLTDKGKQEAAQLP